MRVTTKDVDTESVSLISSPKDKVSPHSEETIDYETLLTLALEKTTVHNSRLLRRKQKLLIFFITTSLIVVISFLGNGLLAATRVEHKMDKEINELEVKISKLDKELGLLEEPQDAKNSTKIPLSVPP